MFLALLLQTSAVSVFDHVSLATMAKTQTKDSVLGLVIQHMCMCVRGINWKGSAIFKN